MMLLVGHIPEKKNAFMDQLSCPFQILPTELSLFPWLFNTICEVYGHPVYLFATKANVELPFHVFDSGCHGTETEHLSISVGRSQCLCVSPFRSSQTGIVKSYAFNKSLLGPGCSLWPQE